MTIAEAIYIVQQDTDSGLIGRAARANCPEAYVLIAAYNRWHRDANDFNELRLIEAVMNWQTAVVAEKGV